MMRNLCRAVVCAIIAGVSGLSLAEFSAQPYESVTSFIQHEWQSTVRTCTVETNT